MKVFVGIQLGIRQLFVLHDSGAVSMTRLAQDALDYLERHLPALTKSDLEALQSYSITPSSVR